MSTPDFESLVAKQKDRVIASILEFKDRDCNEFLPVDVNKALRKVVLDQVNDFANFVTELHNSLDNGAVLNQQFYEKLDEVLEIVRG